jgi:hypothetical protein
MSNRTTTVIEALASRIQAYHNCSERNAVEQRNSLQPDMTWINRHADAIEAIAKLLPRGSGIDSGTTVDIDKSTADRIVLNADFHHMDEHGFYDGWTEHQIIVSPSFIGRFSIRVTGRDRNGIKEYLSETYHYTLDQPLIETWNTEQEQAEYAIAR